MKSSRAVYVRFLRYFWRRVPSLLDVKQGQVFKLGTELWRATTDGEPSKFTNGSIGMIQAESLSGKGENIFEIHQRPHGGTS